MSKPRERSFVAIDSEGRPSAVEIAWVGFLHGWVMWVDDDPWNEGEPFASPRAARAELRHYGFTVLA